MKYKIRTKMKTLKRIYVKSVLMFLSIIFIHYIATILYLLYSKLFPSSFLKNTKIINNKSLNKQLKIHTYGHLEIAHVPSIQSLPIWRNAGQHKSTSLLNPQTVEHLNWLLRFTRCRKTLLWIEANLFLSK